MKATTLIILFLTIPSIIEKRTLSAEAVKLNRRDDCKDLDPNCDFYAQAGECQANKKYMLSHCKKSCKACVQTNEKDTILKVAKTTMMAGKQNGNVGNSQSREDSSSDGKSCIHVSDLRRRIEMSYGPDGVVSRHAQGLQVVVDDVLSPSDSRQIVDILGNSFVSDSGYGENLVGTPKAYAGLSLQELASPSLITASNYTTLLELRERIRMRVEETFDLCPGSLKLDFTHFTEKRAGGKHTSHADNCFVVFDEDDPNRPAYCAANMDHPYSHRLVSSILYLNDDFAGGEFYWADHITGQPMKSVQPKPGRLMVFTSGPESLHGALPVLEREGNNQEPSRRLAVGMWYNAADELTEEYVPSFPVASSSSGSMGDEL